jgi:hypothetical protein
VIQLEQAPTRPSLSFGHCEEQSDEAIHWRLHATRWIASLRSQ